MAFQNLRHSCFPLAALKPKFSFSVGVGTHSSTPAVPFLNDPIHLLCSTLNTAQLISDPGIQISSHWHFTPTRDFSRWHFTKKKASMGLAVESKAKAAHAGDALTQRKLSESELEIREYWLSTYRTCQDPAGTYGFQGALFQDTVYNIHYIQWVQRRPLS